MNGEPPAPPTVQKKPYWSIISLVFTGTIYAVYFHGVSRTSAYDGFFFIALIELGLVASGLGLLCVLISALRRETPGWLTIAALAANLSLISISPFH